MSTLLTERPFTSSKYILLHLRATGKDGEVAMYFPLIHQELNPTVKRGKCKQGEAGSQPLFFVSVSRRADINPQIGDKADKLKGDTEKRYIQEGHTQLFCLLSVISAKTITVK